jgi:hypothetical protein
MMPHCLLDAICRACGQSRFSGGYHFSILVGLSNGKFRKIFDQRIWAYEIDPGPGTRTMRFQLHRGFCGAVGTGECVKRGRISAVPFEYRD